MKTLTEDEWIEKYRPIKNTITNNESWDGCYHETYGADLDFIIERAKTQPNTVWTYLTGDGDVITNGFHLVNRFGYFVTEVPFESDEIIEVPLDFDLDEGEEF